MPSLSPVDSPLLGREPRAEAIARYSGRVIRFPTAAEPQNPSPPPSMGEVPEGRRRFSLKSLRT